MARKPLGEILIEMGVINEEQRDEGLRYQQDKGCKFGEALMEIGAITLDDIYMAMAKQFGYPFIKLSEYKVADSIITLVPAETVHKYQIVPIGYNEDNNKLSLAIAPPFDFNIIGKLQKLLNKEIKITLTSPPQIERAINQYYG